MSKQTMLERQRRKAQKIHYYTDHLFELYGITMEYVQLDDDYTEFVLINDHKNTYRLNTNISSIGSIIENIIEFFYYYTKDYKNLPENALKIQGMTIR